MSQPDLKNATLRIAYAGSPCTLVCEPGKEGVWQHGEGCTCTPVHSEYVVSWDVDENGGAINVVTMKSVSMTGYVRPAAEEP